MNTEEEETAVCSASVSCYLGPAMGGAWRSVATVLRDSGPLWTATLILDRILPVGLLGLWPDRHIAPETLAAQLDTILRAWGMSPEHAAITVDKILYADLHGIDSHGSSMLVHYHRGVADGSLSMTPAIEVVRESATTALIDGGGGLGHVPADMAVRLAIEKCRAAGVAVVAVRHSGHYGAAGAYAAMAAQAGFIGMATTSTASPAVVPTFANEAMLGTNPIAFAAPATRNQPFLLDMATSTAALGKLTTAWRKGRAIPEGWALDRLGRPVTSGRVGAQGRRLTPLGASAEMGSHKGYGLGAMVEILSTVLPGAHAAGGTDSVGHFFFVLDPARFRAEGEFGAELDGLIDFLHGAKPLERRRPVLVAGDPEYAAFAQRSRAGIPLPRGVVEDLRSVARASGVAFKLGK